MRYSKWLAAALLCAAAPVSAAEPAAPTRDPAAESRSFRMPGSLGSLPRRWDDHTGFVPLFDGKTLKGWDGDPAVWRVEDGAITAVRAPGSLRNNDYLVYRGIEARDFDLRLEIRIESGGTGIQYRSRTGLPWTNGLTRGAPPPVLKWMMTGPQADLWWPNPARTQIYHGQVYIENSPERVVSWRGEVTRRGADKRPRVIGAVGDPAALGAAVHPAEWNEYEIVARGGVLMHFINGQLMATAIDDDPRSPNNRSGLIGIEAEMSPARIQVRNVWLRKLN
jgi:hypothetical protein